VYIHYYTSQNTTIIYIIYGCFRWFINYYNEIRIGTIRLPKRSIIFGPLNTGSSTGIILCIYTQCLWCNNTCRVFINHIYIMQERASQNRIVVAMKSFVLHTESLLFGGSLNSNNYLILYKTRIQIIIIIIIIIMDLCW